MGWPRVVVGDAAHMASRRGTKGRQWMGEVRRRAMGGFLPLVIDMAFLMGEDLLSRVWGVVMWTEGVPRGQK